MGNLENKDMGSILFQSSLLETLCATDIFMKKGNNGGATRIFKQFGGKCTLYARNLVSENLVQDIRLERARACLLS